MNLSYRAKISLIFIAVAIVLILLCGYSSRKFIDAKEDLATILVQEVPSTVDVSKSFLAYKNIAENMSLEIKESFENNGYSLTHSSVNNYVVQIDKYIKDIVASNKNISGAWLVINPDLFLGTENRQIKSKFSTDLRP